MRWLGATGGLTSAARRRHRRTIKASDLAENVHIVHSLMSKTEKRGRGAVGQINGDAGGEQRIDLSRESIAPSFDVAGRFMPVVTSTAGTLKKTYSPGPDG